tara:strand:- start:30 stop:515 length:486 start_codon:yes stop_codon:yes gene_type:complete
MGSLSSELRRQVAIPALEALVAGFEQGLQIYTPTVTGLLKSSSKVYRSGPEEYTLIGPSYALEVEYGTPEPVSEKWTRSHRQRYHGTLRWVTRTYSNYQRPRKIPALEGDEKGPWRIVSQRGRMGHGYIKQSMQQSMIEVLSAGGSLSAALPKSIEITSLG